MLFVTIGGKKKKKERRENGQEARDKIQENREESIERF
jgi:hypothetical protein